MPRTTVTAMFRRNAGPVVAPDRPDRELAGERAQDQEDRRPARTNGSAWRLNASVRASSSWSIGGHGRVSPGR